MNRNPLPGDRVRSDLYGAGTVRTNDGATCRVLFDRDRLTRATRRVWTEDLRAGERFYPGLPTPPASGPKLVA